MFVLIVTLTAALVYSVLGAIFAGIMRRYDKIDHEPAEVGLFILIWPAFMFIWPLLWIYSKVAGEEI